MPRRTAGFTILELLILLAVLGILFGIAAWDVRPLNNDARNAAHQLASAVHITRTRAMATTSAHRLVVAGPSELRVEAAVRCDDPEADWSTENAFATTFPRGAALQGVAPAEVLTCFDPRGIGNASPTLTIQDGRGRTATVDLYAGGGVELR